MWRQQIEGIMTWARKGQLTRWHVVSVDITIKLFCNSAFAVALTVVALGVPTLSLVFTAVWCKHLLAVFFVKCDLKVERVSLLVLLKELLLKRIAKPTFEIQCCLCKALTCKTMNKRFTRNENNVPFRNNNIASFNTQQTQTKHKMALQCIWDNNKQTLTQKKLMQLKMLTKNTKMPSTGFSLSLATIVLLCKNVNVRRHHFQKGN